MSPSKRTRASDSPNIRKYPTARAMTGTSSAATANASRHLVVRSDPPIDAAYAAGTARMHAPVAALKAISMLRSIDWVQNGCAALENHRPLKPETSRNRDADTARGNTKAAGAATAPAMRIAIAARADLITV